VIDTQTVEQPRKKGRPSNGLRAEKISAVTKMVQSHPNATVREIAAGAGVSKTTAQAYLSKWGINKTELDTFVENRNSIVKSKQQLVLDALTQEKANKSTFKDLAVAYGILLDKDRLESGESTSNIASWTHLVSQSHKVQVIDNTKVE